jgi:hypothetical protein
LATSLQETLNGAVLSQREFLDFERDLPGMSAQLSKNVDDISFLDIRRLMKEWIQELNETHAAVRR